jgi:uncharacterized phage infection (PIP) family protein YhgE
MTKLEIVKSLNDSGPQLRIVESVRNLQQAVSQMHEDLNHLPDAISARVAEALEPLARLRQDAKQVLEAYDKVLAVQRQAIDETTQEMTRRAAQAFETKAQALDGSIRDLSSSAAMLRSSIDSLNDTAQSMTQAANQLIEAANEARQGWWYQMLMLILAVIVGVTVATTGRAVFEKLVPPPSAVQQQALWSKSTPQERALMTQIVNRPGR